MISSKKDKQAFLTDPEHWFNTQQLEVCQASLNEILSDKANQLKHHKKIKEEMGVLSRKIGAAKKQKEDSTQLIADMQKLSADAKAVQGTIREAEECLLSLAEQALETSASPASEDQALNVQFAAFSEQEFEHIEIAELKDQEPNGQGFEACVEFVKMHPQASVYHLPNWGGLLNKVFGHKSIYLYARAEGRVLGVLPLVQLSSRLFGNFIVSMPFFNYGGVLAINDQVAQLLFDKGQLFAKALGAHHIEYRSRSKYSQMPGHEDKVSMWLALPDKAEQLWEAIGTKLRAQIKKAQRLGLQTEVGGEELLDDFYQVFSVNMRDLGTPVYSKNFFRKILQNKFSSTRLVIVRHQGKAVSGAFLIGFQERIEVPWASTLRDANPTNANMLLYWTMLDYACSSGYKTFDFGRSSKDASTYNFKKQWGAQPVQLYWHYGLPEGAELPRLNPNNPKYKLLIAVWKRLPVWLSRMIGPLVVKNLP